MSDQTEDMEPRIESRVDAAEAGRTRFIGGPCVRCGSKIRHTINASCVACTVVRSKRRQEKIRDLLRAAQGKGGEA